MRVLFVTSEIYPLAKTGGLADVSQALPLALRDQGVDVCALMPGYPSALEGLADRRIEMSLDGILGVEGARLIRGRAPDCDLPVLLIDAPSLYGRDGGPYQDRQGNAWPDNPRRFAYLNHVAARIGMGLLTSGWKPDLVHANDWHTGLTPLLLSAMGQGRPATLFTIHNMAFQGNFPPETLPAMELPDDVFHADGLEFYGQASLLKAGIRYSDFVTTVSPTYARETLAPEFGMGMEGLLAQRAGAFVGILNGVDCAVWDPSRDPHTPSRFDANDLSGKRRCKIELQRELGFTPDPDTPVIAFVSRLTRQKMADVLLEVLPWLAEQDAQFVLLSDGDKDLEQAFRQAAERRPDKLAVNIGYQEAFAHRIHAGADMVLAPARFEPCGLTQLYAMRYGALPIVRRVGGLADTVHGPGQPGAAATGFLFDDPDKHAMTGAIAHAIELFQEPLTWRRMQLNAMTQDFGWVPSASRYLSIYRSLAETDLQAGERRRKRRAPAETAVLASSSPAEPQPFAARSAALA